MVKTEAGHGGAEVDAGRVTATYEHGVLSINLPKTREASVKKIEVKAAQPSIPAKGSG